MKIALVSLDQKWEDKQGNQDQCSLISKIISENTADIDLIIYPEMTLTGFSVANDSLSESESNSESITFFKELSVKTHISHLFGLAVKNSDNRHYNRCCYINEYGEILAQYDKIHTFSFAGENELYSRGNTPEVVEINGAKIGLTICFDLRFSPLYSYYREKCNLVVNIANWPSVREGHWLNLLQSRSIENQFFMIGVNRTGMDGNGLLYRHSSFVYNPLGEIVSPIFSDREYAIYDIDLQYAKTVRSKFPFIEDLRTELYSNF
jgi:omega-amidase